MQRSSFLHLREALGLPPTSILHWRPKQTRTASTCKHLSASHLGLHYRNTQVLIIKIWPAVSPQCIRLNSSCSRSTRQYEEGEATSQSSLLETWEAWRWHLCGSGWCPGCQSSRGWCDTLLELSSQANHPSPGSLAPSTLSFTQTNPSHPSLPATHSCPAPPAWPSGPGEVKCWRSGSAVEKEHFFLSPSLCCFEPPWLAYSDATQAGRWQEGRGEERCGDAKGLQHSWTGHFTRCVSAQVAGAASGKAEPNCLQWALD